MNNFKQNKKILILGSTGLLGVPLSIFLQNSGYNVVRHGLRNKSDYNSDMTNYKEVDKILSEVKPDFIINLVALTDVDKCEENPHTAYLINVRPVENIIKWFLNNKSCLKLIQISTDQVYDGEGEHKEDDVVLRNTYALTKYCAEQVAMRINSCVIRTNFVGKSMIYNRQSFSDWVFENLNNRKKIKLFNDIKFSPVSIQTLCRMISIVIENFRTGVFNIGSKNGMSKKEFAILFAKKLNLPTEFAEESLSTEFGFKAYRPKDMRMDSILFEKVFNVCMPTLFDEIELIRSDYESKN